MSYIFANAAIQIDSTAISFVALAIVFASRTLYLDDVTAIIANSLIKKFIPRPLSAGKMIR